MRVTKIFEVLYVVFLLAIAGIAVINLASRNVDKSPLKILSIVSGSMSPSMPVGTAVFVREAPEYRVNDVVTYRLNNKFVTHRVVYANNDYYLTQGDANKNLDKLPVNRDQISGKVVFFLPYVGYLQESTKTWWGLIGLVYVPTLLIVIVESRSIMREFNRVGRKKINMQAIAPVGMSLFILSGISFAFYSTTIVAFSGDITSSFATTSPSPSPSGSEDPSPTVAGTSAPGPTDTPGPSSSASASPSASPTVLPTATASASASPSSSGFPCGTGFIGNCGNGAGSNNTVIVGNNSSTVVNQQNNSQVNTTVTVNSNTGNNSSSGNTSGTVLTINTSTVTNSSSVSVGQ